MDQEQTFQLNWQQNTFDGLNDAILNEIVRAMALPRNKYVKALIGSLVGRATRRFSELVLGMDWQIGLHGPSAGAQWLLPNFIAGSQAHGLENIPEKGPLLIVSNHPASYDGLLIAGFINRPDLKIIVGEIPPYQYLKNISRHTIFSPPVQNTSGRMGTVREAIQHLKQQGALLLFPRGGIEPDPAFMREPDAEFDRWSRSLEIFIRQVPSSKVLVSMVSGVIAPDAMRHPITWFRRSRPDRQRLAFIYQIILQIMSGKELFGLRPVVTFGEVLSGLDQAEILKEVEAAARRTLLRHSTHLNQQVGGE